MYSNPDPLHYLEPELEPGESLRWIGRPNPLRMLKRSAVVLLYAIPWTLFSLILLFASRGRLWLRLLVHGISAALGAYRAAAPVVSYFAARRMIYAVTDRRIIIMITGASRRVWSYPEREIGEFARVEFPDGSGDFTFSRRQYQDNYGRWYTEDISFVGVADVREVERIVREAFAKKGRAETPEA